MLHRRLRLLSTLGLLTLSAVGACSSGNDGNDVGGSGPGGATSQGSGGRGSGVDDGADADGSPGGSGAVVCENENPTLTVTKLDGLAIADMAKTFDTDGDDRVGPNSWNARYGKTPEIVPVVHADGLAILFQGQPDPDVKDAPLPPDAFVVHVTKTGDDYAVDAAYQVKSLGRIMGFTRDEAGNYYVASGIDEGALVTATYPPNDIHRPDIVRVVKFDQNGCVSMESDVDMERGKKDEGSQIIVNPMVASSSRLVWGADRLLLVHGHNVEYDAKVSARHQMSVATHLDANTGTATRTSTMWVSHSFDQRVLFDGQGLIEFHLGDAYPRALAWGRYTDTEEKGGYQPFRIKGDIGENETRTRLGGVVQTADATYGYLALFSTEGNDLTDAVVTTQRNLAIMRIRTDFTTLSTDDSIVDEGAGTVTLTSTQGANSYDNHLRWLTNLPANTHAERPRLAAIGGEKFVVLFERWTTSGADAGNDAYTGTYGLVVDATGAEVTALAEIPGQHALGRGDDVVALDGRAVYVTGNGSSLWLNFVDGSLASERVELP